MLQRIQRVLVAALLGLAALTALIFAGDYAVYKFRAARWPGVYGSVSVNRYYAVAQKNGRTQFIFQPTEVQTCIHTMFPHSGFQPCWYLSRHTERRTDI